MLLALLAGSCIIQARHTGKPLNGYFIIWKVLQILGWYLINIEPISEEVGYVDADYGGDLDRRRSLSAYIFTLCGSAISWYSSLQAIAVLSTTEAEYIVATEGMK